MGAHGGYSVDPWYRPTANPVERFKTATSERSYETRILEPGDSFEPLTVAVES